MKNFSRIAGLAALMQIQTITASAESVQSQIMEILQPCKVYYGVLNKGEGLPVTRESIGNIIKCSEAEIAAIEFAEGNPLSPDAGEVLAHTTPETKLNLQHGINMMRTIQQLLPSVQVSGVAEKD